MRYTHFPGCSLESTGVGYATSVRAVCDDLGLEMKDLSDWNCCGSTAYFSIDELVSLCLSGRNLALAEAQGDELVASCSACYVNLRKTNRYLSQYPEMKRNVDIALATGGMKYGGKVRVRHLAEVLLLDVGLDAIADRVQRPLRRLKVATYYGCCLVRPDAGFDHPEFPQSLARLTEALGADPIKFPLMSRCCGGSLILTEERIALGLMNKLLKSATQAGAQIMITACPLCHLNLDAYQSKVNGQFSTAHRMPVLFFTQLIGLALGIDPEALGIDKNIVPATELLAAYV